VEFDGAVAQDGVAVSDGLILVHSFAYSALSGVLREIPPAFSAWGAMNAAV
jgi:hypothetical protein